MVEPAGVAAEREILFGPFHVFPKQRLLLEGDKLVRLGSRAWDILIALIERPGEPVSREELMARVWPDTVVVEGNLPVHMAALRRALGDGHDGNRYVVTIPGPQLTPPPRARCARRARSARSRQSVPSFRRHRAAEDPAAPPTPPGLAPPSSTPSPLHLGA